MSKGIGGYGIFMEYLGKSREIYGYEKDTTNNRMELMACIVALKTIKTYKISIIIYSDSQYVVSGCTKWIVQWMNNDWKTAKKDDVLNQDLWKELVELCFKFQVEFIHVKGHSGNVGNERADKLANKAMDEFLSNSGDAK